MNDVVDDDSRVYVEIRVSVGERDGGAFEYGCFECGKCGVNVDVGMGVGVDICVGVVGFVVLDVCVWILNCRFVDANDDFVEANVSIVLREFVERF